MKIRIGFNGSFTGLLYSAGMLAIKYAPLCTQLIFQNVLIMFDFCDNFFLILPSIHTHTRCCTKGYAYDPDCMYINGSGRDYYEFYIQLNRCGTLGKNAISEKSRENPTVRI